MKEGRTLTILSTVISFTTFTAMVVVLPLAMVRIQERNTMLLDMVEECRINAHTVWKHASGLEPLRYRRSQYATAPIRPSGYRVQAIGTGNSCCSCRQGPRGLPGKAGKPGADGKPGAPGGAGRNGRPGGYVDPQVLAQEPCQKCPPAIPGPPGQPGVKGNRGLSGNPGQPGTSGTPGMKGPRGLVGPPGPPGEPGMDGPQGDPGRILEGAHIGPAGPGGQVGPRGRTGGRGRDGDDGAKGPKGSKGFVGERGPPGQLGKQGPPGTPGRPGPKGSCDHCPQDGAKKPSTNGGYDSSDLPEGVYESLVAAISEKVTEATTTAPTTSTAGPVAADFETANAANAVNEAKKGTAPPRAAAAPLLQLEGRSLYENGRRSTLYFRKKKKDKKLIQLPSN